MEQTKTLKFVHKVNHKGANKKVFRMVNDSNNNNDENNYILLSSANNSGSNKYNTMDKFKKLCNKFKWLPNRPIAFCEYDKEIFALYKFCKSTVSDFCGISVNKTNHVFRNKNDKKYKFDEYMGVYLDILIEVLFLNFTSHTYFDIKI